MKRYITMIAVLLVVFSTSVSAQSRRERREERVATENRTVRPVAGGHVFQLPVSFEQAYPVVVSYVNRKNYPIDPENTKDSLGQVFTSIYDMNKNEDEGTRLRVTIIKDDVAKTTFRVVIEHLKRTKWKSDSSWKSQGVDEQASRAEGDQIAGMFGLNTVSAPVLTPAPTVTNVSKVEPVASSVASTALVADESGAIRFVIPYDLDHAWTQVMAKINGVYGSEAVNQEDTSKDNLRITVVKMDDPENGTKVLVTLNDALDGCTGVVVAAQDVKKKTINLGFRKVSVPKGIPWSAKDNNPEKSRAQAELLAQRFGIGAPSNAIAQK